MKLAGMVDIETLASHPNAAVIAIGVCIFDDKEVYDSMEILLDPRLSPGHRDPDTLRWWNEQDPEVFKKMMSGDAAPWLACDMLAGFIRETGIKELWANPPTFDIAILRGLFKRYGKEFPIHYTGERDYRTIRKMADEFDIDYGEPYRERSAHDAMDDAICQARALQIMLRDLALL